MAIWRVCPHFIEVTALLNSRQIAPFEQPSPSLPSSEHHHQLDHLDQHDDYVQCHNGYCKDNDRVISSLLFWCERIDHTELWSKNADVVNFDDLLCSDVDDADEADDDADGETKCSIRRREDVPGNVDPGSSPSQLHTSDRQRQLLLALALPSRHSAADDSSCV